METQPLRPFTGIVQSGMGDFSIWMKVLSAFYRKKTDTQLFPGTLNVQLEVDYNLPDQRIRLEATEYGGNVSVNIIPCKIFDQPAFVLRTDKNDAGLGDHPRNIVEIAAEVKLRDRFCLKDGDRVELWLP
jgi:riboflavin kinase, archaea type